MDTKIMTPTCVLEKEDIQGLITRSYGKLDYASFSVLSFKDDAKGKAYLNEISGSITNAAVDPEEVALNVAFTFEGMKFLGLSADSLNSFSREFKEGMTEQHRQFILGDVEKNSPLDWEWGGPKNTPIHLLLLLYAKDETTLNTAHNVQKAHFATYEIAETERLGSQLLPNNKEHFGFRDGISQPFVDGFGSKDPGPGEEVMPPGEFILGYQNWYDQYPDSPHVAIGHDPDDILPPKPYEPTAKDLGKNGSYLVFRQMSQEVACFWEYMKSSGYEPAISAEEGAIKLASKMVGRWPSGAPLIKSPDHDNPDLATDNNFKYWNEDFEGLKCPVGAHVRRTNPRDWLLTEKTALESEEMIRKHRILRRGRPYGDPLASKMDTPDLMNAADDGKKRGLHFMCFVGDLIRQFEFIQNAWARFHQFGGLYEDSDPIIGTHYQANGVVTDSFTVQDQPRRRYKAVPQFTQVRGGAYFFFPGINAIKYLASDPTLGDVPVFEGEEVPPKEVEHIKSMLEDMRFFLEEHHPPGEMKRHFHPKMHGCVSAKFIVEENLPENLQKGLFKTPKTYESWVRFSSAPPKEKSDRKASGLGLAIKVLDVDGTTIGSSAEEVPVQDFLMTTSPILSPGTVSNYRRAIKLIVRGFPFNIYYLLDPTNWRRIALTLKFTKKFFNVLEVQYFSGAPILFENGQAIKYAVLPNKSADSKKPKKGRDFFLRERLISDLGNEEAAFDFMIQFQTNPKKEPIENTSRQWKSPFYKVATLVIPKQAFANEERILFGENLLFSPWQCLIQHRPLGGINRARREVYRVLGEFRQRQNGTK